MLDQSPVAILMVRPSSFGYNEETAISNAFQSSPSVEKNEIHQQALSEFNGMVNTLRANEIEVEIFEDLETPVTPDAIFPNNWFSTHHEGKIFTYPMEAKNRRIERRSDIIDFLKQKYGYKEFYDFSSFENKGQYLEGTGSIVFDHIARKAYACNSSRMDKALLTRLCSMIEYKPICFDAFDSHGIPIYHTNVMMCLASELAIVCLKSIDEAGRMRLYNHLRMDGKKIIDISFEQMASFAGNMLEVQNKLGKKYLVMSESAFQSLGNNQIKDISSALEIITVDIPTIERYGGGGVRCMMAGIHR